MTDRPIIFSGPMVKALLDGRKTQTRRKLPSAHPRFPDHNILEPDLLDDKRQVWFWDGVHHNVGASWKLPIATGDRLWVREAHYLTDVPALDDEYAVFAEDVTGVDDHFMQMHDLMASWPSIDWSKHIRLRPSIHMPRWASRLTLTVTDVRVQRLQDISEADAIAEGVEDVSADWLVAKPAYRAYGQTACFTGAAAARLSFMTLWNSLHGPEAWDANPWIAAYTFTVQRGNIDQIENASKPTTHRQRGGYTGGV